MHRFNTWAVVMAVALCLAPLKPASAVIIDRVMAIVNGQIITLSDVTAAVQLGIVSTAGVDDPIGAALTQLIERRLELAEVDRYGPREPTPEQIQARVDLIRARVGDPAALKRILDLCGLTDEQLRGELRDDLRIQAYLTQRFAGAGRATEEELIRYYDEHRAAFARPSGEVPPFEEIRGVVASARERERVRELVATWVNDLRRRGEVLILYKQ